MEDKAFDETSIDDQLPAIFVPNKPMEVTVTSESPLKEIVREDIEHINMTLQAIHQSWSKANSVNDVCKLAMTQAMILTYRRKLLLQPTSYSEANGAALNGNNNRRMEFEPL